MRIGIYGGSFDPPHIGHRVLAADAAEALGLEKLFIVPAGIQPLKGDTLHSATPVQRLEMVRLAFHGNDFIAVDESEMNRPGLSFTVDTLEQYSARFPGAEIFLLLGRDSYESLDKWKNPERIRRLSTIAILDRGDRASACDEGARIVATRRIDVSSSEVRARRREGRSIAGFVPDGVLRYIEENNLYASSGASQE